MAKVNKNMIIMDVLKMDPDCAQIFFKNGLHCIGCPSASGETIEEASAVHGLDPNKLIRELNEYFES